jgi:hypothetical protein
LKRLLNHKKICGKDYITLPCMLHIENVQTSIVC